MLSVVAPREVDYVDDVYPLVPQRSSMLSWAMATSPASFPPTLPNDGESTHTTQVLDLDGDGFPANVTYTVSLSHGIDGVMKHNNQCPHA